MRTCDTNMDEADANPPLRRLTLFRHVRRWLSYSLVTLSALLCLAAVTMLARSYWRRDSVTVHHMPSDHERAVRVLVSQSGTAYYDHHISVFRVPLPQAGEPVLWLWESTSDPQPWTPFGSAKTSRVLSVFGLDGVSGQGENKRSSYRSTTMSIHWWPLALLFALSPAVAVARWVLQICRRRRSLRQGHCRTCGYDLRGTPNRCPECGAATAALDPIEKPGTKTTQK